MSQIDILKRMRLIMVGVGIALLLIAMVGARMEYAAADRETADGNAVLAQVETNNLLRSQLHRMQRSVRQRALLLTPFCKAHPGALFQKALIIAPGLSANLTGDVGIAPSPAPQASQAPIIATPPPSGTDNQNALQRAIGSVTSAMHPQTASGAAQPTPPPMLVTRGIGENVTGPFLLIVRALNDLPKDSSIIAADVQTIQQTHNDKDGANDVLFVMTLESAQVQPSLCSQIVADARPVRRQPVLPSLAAPTSTSMLVPAHPPRTPERHRS
jgi:hypothetical protein